MPPAFRACVPRTRRLPAARKHHARAGFVALGILVIMLLLAAIAISVTSSHARDSGNTQAQVEGARAQAAVDGVLNMSAKELLDSADHDGDGGIGSISDNSNSADDPVISNSRVWSRRTANSNTVTITAHASNASSRRASRLNANVSSSASDFTLFSTQASPPRILRSQLNQSASTWSAPTTVGTTTHAPAWIAAAPTAGGSAVLASDSDLDLLYGLVGASGIASFSSICSSVGTLAARPFDIATLNATRGGILAYYNGAGTVSYRTITGTSLSSASTVAIPINVSPDYSSSVITWVKLVPLSSTSDQVMLFTIHDCGCCWAARWTGSSWTDFVHIAGEINSPATQEGLDAVVEPVSGKLMVVFSDSTANRVGYRRYTSGTGWSSASYISSLGASANTVRLAARPGTNEVHLAIGLTSATLRTAFWSGTAWSASTSITASFSASRGFDVGVTPNGASATLVYGKNTSSLYYRLWSGSAWSSEYSLLSLSSGNTRNILIIPGTSGTNQAGVVSDSAGGANVGWSGASLVVTRPVTTSSTYASYDWFTIVPPSSVSRPTISSITSIDPTTP